MAVVAVLQRTLDRNAQAGWICHGSSRLRLPPRLLRKITKWYGSATTGIGNSGPGPKGSAKDRLESDITVGFDGRVKATSSSI